MQKPESTSDLRGVMDRCDNDMGGASTSTDLPLVSCTTSLDDGMECGLLRSFLERLLSNTAATTNTVAYTEKVKMLHKSFLFAQNSDHSNSRDLQSLAPLLVRGALHVMCECPKAVDNNMPQPRDIALHLFRQVVLKIPDVLLAPSTAPSGDDYNLDASTLFGKTVEVLFKLSCQYNEMSNVSSPTKVCLTAIQ